MRLEIEASLNNDEFNLALANFALAKAGINGPHGGDISVDLILTNCHGVTERATANVKIVIPDFKP